MGPAGCSRVVLRKRALILNYCGFERYDILMESGSKMAMFSGRTIYVIGLLQLAYKISPILRGSLDYASY